MQIRSMVPLAAGTLAGAALLAGVLAYGGAQPAPPIIALDSTSAPTLERSLCVTAFLGDAAAAECGELRLAHDLPRTWTLGREHAPALLYSSAHARPFVRISADVALPGGSSGLDRVVATLRVNGMPRGQSVYAGDLWPGTARTRVAVGYSAGTDATNRYRYTLEVAAYYTTGVFTDSAAGVLHVVNRAASPFGAGWWLAGLEQLRFDPFRSSALWVGGDGSVRHYARVPGDSTAWTAANPLRPDTLRLEAGGTYARRLRGGAIARFDSLGRHIATVDRLGYTTDFGYTGERLSTVRLPVVSGARPTYRFQYDGAGRLIGISAPATRALTLEQPGVGDRRVAAIAGPDTTRVQFQYEGTTARVAARLDRRGHPTVFRYDAAGTVTAARLDLESGDSVVTRVRAAEAVGFSMPDGSGAVPSDSAFTLVDGPREDVSDHTRFHVDRYGAPATILDAHGSITRLLREDAALPAAVTEIRLPNGWIVRAGYDARGNLARRIELDTYFDSRADTTHYEWHPRWDRPERIEPPTGEVTLLAYDSLTGNLLARQAETGERRVETDHDPVTRLPVAFRRIGVPGADSVFHNALGNVQHTRDPLGFRTLRYADAAGRDTLIITPIDTASARDTALLRTNGLRQRIDYDVMDRVVRAVSRGPAQQSCPGCPSSPGTDSLAVTNEYDGDGNLLFVLRRVSDTEVFAVEYRYDAAGRRTSQRTPVRDTLIYDPAGNVVAYHRGSSTFALMEYDARGRLTQRVIPGVQHAQSTCAPFTGMTCEYRFPLYPNGPDSSWVVPADTQRFTYDAVGNLLTATNRDALISRQYFRNGLVHRDTVRLRAYSKLPEEEEAYALHVYGLRYEYDASGRRTALHLPTNLFGGVQRTTTYGYRPDTGELELVVGPGGDTHQFLFDHAGRDSVRLFPSGYESLVLDAADRISLRQEMSTTAGAIRSAQYHYDARGKLLLATGDAQFSASYTATHWYASHGALIGTDVVGVGNDHLEDWTVDVLGNVLTNRRVPHQQSVPGVRHSYHYAGEQLTAIEPEWPVPLETTGMVGDSVLNEHDGRGNLVYMGRARTVSGGGGIRTLVHEVAARSFWGQQDRLHAHQRYSISHGDDQLREGVFEEYRYDPLGRRVLLRTRMDDLCAGYNFCHSSITRQIWDGEQLLMELRAPGGNNLSAAELEEITGPDPLYGRITYVHGAALDRPLAIFREQNIGNPIMPHLNWRGLYDVATRIDGSFVTDAIDWPGRTWGSYMDEDRDSKPRPHWWGSLIMDQKDASGLVYRRNRYYDPMSGRFTQEDPIGLAGGLNLYGFANGDPVSYSDPFGLNPCLTGSGWYECIRRAGLAAMERTAEGIALVGQAYREVGIEIASTVVPVSRLGARLLRSADEGIGVLRGTKYTSKVIDDIGRGDLHAFPLEVDNFVRGASVSPFRGGDGVVRQKVSLPGHYRGRDGTFEWIIEPDKTINHRFFRPDGS